MITITLPEWLVWTALSMWGVFLGLRLGQVYYTSRVAYYKRQTNEIYAELIELAKKSRKEAKNAKAKAK